MLREASAKGDLKAVLDITQSNSFERFICDKNASSLLGNTALHLAAEAGHFPVVRYLVEKLAVDTSIKNKDLKTALDIANNKEQTSIRIYLTIVKKLELEYQLRLAAATGDITKLSAILADPFFQEYGDINSVASSNSFTALHYAAERNQCEAVKLLLAQGCDINRQDYKFRTAIDVAAAKKNADLVCFLKQHQTQSPQPQPLDIDFSQQLANANFSEFKDLLTNKNIELGCDLLMELSNGTDYSAKMEFLIEQHQGNINIHEPTDYHNTSVHALIVNNQSDEALQIIKLAANIMRNRYNPNLQDIYGRTALMLAIVYGYNDIVEFLLNHHYLLKLNLLVQDNNKLNLLHYAAIARNELAAELIISLAPGLLATVDSNGLSPIEYLQEQYRHHLTDLLTSVSINPERDAKAKTDTLQIFGNPIILRNKMEQLREEAGNETINQILHLSLGTNLERFSTTANYAAIKDYSPNDIFVLKVNKWLLLSNEQLQKECSDFQAMVKQFAGKSLQEILIEKTETLQIKFALALLARVRSFKDKEAALLAGKLFYNGKNGFPQDFIEAYNCFLIATRIEPSTAEELAYLATLLSQKKKNFPSHDEREKFRLVAQLNQEQTGKIQQNSIFKTMKTVDIGHLKEPFPLEEELAQRLAQISPITESLERLTLNR